MTSKKGLLIFGFGGHARSVADVALAVGYQELLFVDENAKDGENFLGYSVQRKYQDDLPDGWVCMPGAGNNKCRQSQIEYAHKLGWTIATLIAPSASISTSASISVGSFVAHHSHVGPLAEIGVGCIVNTSAVIEHECIIGDFSHISVHSTVAGRSKIGRFAFIGAGATVIDGLTLGDDITVGAGGVVITSIKESGTYIGVPARMMPPKIAKIIP